MSNDAPDPQDAAEALDSDTLGTPDDVEIEPDYPVDQLLGADDYGTTAAEEQVGEPLDERVERERPEPLVQELEHAEDLAVAQADSGAVTAALDALELQLDEETLAAIDGIEPLLADEDRLGEGDDDSDEVGRLIEPGVGDDVFGVDDEPDAVARAIVEDDLSAEESAVHLTEDPPMGTRGGDYV